MTIEFLDHLYKLTTMLGITGHTSIKIKDEDVKVWTTEPDGAGIKDKIDRIYLSSDRISITSLIFGDIKLVRYYKSDWQEIVVNARQGERQVHVFSLDCRHKNDELEKIFWYMGRFG